MDVTIWAEQVSVAVKKYARGKSREDQDDLTQECYLALVKAEAKLREADNPESMAYVIARNRLIDIFRQQKPTKETYDLHDLTAELLQAHASTESDIIRSVDLKKAMLELDGEEQIIVESLFFAHKMVSEVAKELKITRRSVQDKRASALKKLRTALDGRD